MAYIQCGTVTKTASDGKGFTLRLRLVLYVDRSVSPYRYRVYVDSVRYYASTTLLNQLYSAGTNRTRLMLSNASGAYEIDTGQINFSMTIHTDSSGSYIEAAAPGYYDLSNNGRQYSYDFRAYLTGMATTRNSQGQATIHSATVSNNFIFPKYYNMQITAPATVILNNVNTFPCEAIDLSSLSGYASNMSFSAYGAFGQNYERTSDLYISSTAKPAKDSAFNALSWYPSILQVATGDFINNTSRYKIFFELTSTSSGLDDNRLAWGEITGYIQYNETPQAGANPAVSVAVTEISGVGLFATYGRYLVGKSQIRLAASISAPFGYGQSILTRTITLNGVTASANQTVWPTVDGTYYAAAVDNHNASNNASLSYQVYNYWDPELSTFAIHRCRQDGTNDDGGAYVKIEWGIHVAPLGNQNSKSLTIVHPQGTATPTLSSYDASGVLIVAADIEHSYDITATLTDDLGSSTRTLRLSTAGAIMDIHHGGDGIAFGKVAELADTLEVTPNWEVILNTTDAKKISLVDALKALATATGVDIYVHSNNS